MSQGQTLAVDSFPRSTVVDSVRIGPLVYRAATILRYSKEGIEESVDIKGDLTTIVTVSNTGSASTPVAPVRCVQEYAFLNPDFRSIPRITGFPSTVACLKTNENFLLGPGESRRLSYFSHNWKHGQYGLLGPLYFVAELQSSDTVARLRSGGSVVSSDVSTLEYHATSAVEGHISSCSRANHSPLLTELPPHRNHFTTSSYSISGSIARLEQLSRLKAIWRLTNNAARLRRSNSIPSLAANPRRPAFDL
jgi:hypothetical protein